MLTPKGEIPSTRGSVEGQTCNAVLHRTASPTHYLLSYSSPRGGSISDAHEAQYLCILSMQNDVLTLLKGKFVRLKRKWHIKLISSASLKAISVFSST